MIVTRTKTYAVCPSCARDAGSIDHLIRQTLSTSLYCDHCGQQYNLDFKNGDVTITIGEGRLIKTYDVLVLEPQEKPVYFVVQGMRFEPGENDPQFFYESHSCPTNWLRPEVVYHDGDSDPHGLIKFAARRDCSSFPDDETVSPNAHDDQLLAFIEEVEKKS